jgi:hypothetical protein
MPDSWGWQRTDQASGVHWVPGDLAASYARVSRDGGLWILVSAVPVSEYYRVLQEARDA